MRLRHIGSAFAALILLGVAYPSRAAPTQVQGVDPTGVVHTFSVDSQGRLTLDPNSVGGGGGGGGGVVTQTTGSNLHVQTDTGSTTAVTGTVNVAGTFWQATQPVSGTFWQATQPVSAVSLPLPSGAATAAKQPALGTAGSASTDVITVQGITSGTPLRVVSTFYPPLYCYAFAAVSGTANLTGYFVDATGLQLNATTSYSSITTTTNFTTLATTIPAGAVGWIGSLSGSDLYINRSGQVGGTSTYTAVSGPKVLQGTYITFGGVSPNP